MKRRITLDCPYCGNQFKLWIEESGNRFPREVVRCDIEETPGCDRMFIIEPEVKIKVQYYRVEKVIDCDWREGFTGD